MQYKPQLELYAHQKKALETVYNQPAFALFMGMRTGKTAVIISEFGMKLYAKEVNALLVIAPAGVYRTWAGELKKHMPADVYDELEIGIWESGKPPPEFIDYAKVLLVNVEAFSTIEKCGMLCEQFLRDNRAMMVIDESTTIKSPTSKRTLAICDIAQLAKYRRILSGLPTPQGPLDLFSQFWFLDPHILAYRNFHEFRRQYAIMRKIKVGTRHVDVVAGYKNIPELSKRIAKHNFRVRLEDCYDVPPKMYVTREVELTPEQVRMYKELKKYATTQLGTSGMFATATEVITQILRMHQLCCGHLVDENGVTHSVRSNRIKELMALLEEYDGKAIIWCSYHHDVQQITQRLRKDYGDDSVAVFYGGNVRDREADSQRFETDPACRWMVATPGSGGRGRTWSMAGLIVYYSNTDNLEHRDQSEERASGMGKADRVTVVDLITRGTVEEKIVHALRNKIDLAATITGDKWREWII